MDRACAFILSAALLATFGCRADNGKADPSVASEASSFVARAAAPSSAPVATPAPAADARPLIICFGDSLTAGLGIEDPDLTYPADLERHLHSEGYDYRVANAGVSGETTKDGLARLPRVIARRPQLVVLEFGGNDGLRGLPTQETQTNLATMIERLQSARITVALAGITLPPSYGGAYISRFNAMYPALASRYHVPLLPMILTNVYNVPGSMQGDGVHPTAQGAEQVATNVEGLIKPLLSH